MRTRLSCGGWSRMLGAMLALVASLGIGGAPSIAGAQTVIGIQAIPAVANPGDTPEVQVVMDRSQRLVAGMQADISWDPNCLSIGSGDNNTPVCYANPQIAKNLSTSFKSGSMLRALLLSMSDVEPIPQDTWLFGCQFTVVPTTTSTQCQISLSNVILSDSKGGRLPAQAINGSIAINQTNSLTGQMQGGPVQAAPVVVAPGVGAVGGAGQAAGSGTGGAAPASSGHGGGSLVVPGLPSGQAPAAEEAAGAAGQAMATPGALIPAPGQTVAAAATPRAGTPRVGTPRAGTPTAGAKTPTAGTPKATAPQSTPSPHGGTPATAKPTPKAHGE